MKSMLSSAPPGWSTTRLSPLSWANANMIFSSFDTSWKPRLPIVANGRNVQNFHSKRIVSYLSIGVPDSEFLTIPSPCPPFPSPSTYNPTPLPSN